MSDFLTPDDHARQADYDHLDSELFDRFEWEDEDPRWVVAVAERDATLAPPD